MSLYEAFSDQGQVSIFRNVVLTRICKSTLISHLVDSYFKVIYSALITMTFPLEQGEVKCFDQGHNGQTT